jgi:uncharacterized phage protein gp47/JayE
MSGYVAPTISAAGLTIPSYNDILEDNIQGYLKIYGANQYVGQDSAIYQLLSILSLKQSDTLQALQFAYNQNSPQYAVGAGLDRIVKLNGIARLSYTYSSAILRIQGARGRVITNGVAQDQNGNQWLLPQTVQIANIGYTDVEATCATPGNITAEPNTINIIATPQNGWATVNNSAAAIPGDAIETDSELRARQSISVALPSQTLLDGVIAAIAAVPGVTRYNVVENFTNETDSNGNPPHSISAVVEGGTEIAVATAIYDQRGLGVYTNGTTLVNVTDPVTELVVPIRYFLPTYVPIYVSLNLYPLAGYTSAMPGLVQDAITNYLNELQIAEIVTQSALVAAAMGVTSLLNPAFSVRSLTLGTAPSPTGTSDIPMNFNQVAQGILANVIITVT